jgi:steroid delta-isomerase-like uncharacterized protein
MAADPRKVVRRLYEEVWNQRKLETVSELIAPSHALNDPHLAGSAVGPEAYKSILAQFIGAFPDLQFSVEDLIAEKNKVVASWTITGTHKREFRGVPATNKKISFDGVTIHHVAGGKIIESFVTMDYLGLMQQLGVIPAQLDKSFRSAIPAG